MLPYFVQVWGRALWQQRLTADVTRLTSAHADAAQPDVAARVTDYYEDRHVEFGQVPPVRYEPGIPSLMDYVLDHAAPSPARDREWRGGFADRSGAVARQG